MYHLCIGISLMFVWGLLKMQFAASKVGKLCVEHSSGRKTTIGQLVVGEKGAITKPSSLANCSKEYSSLMLPLCCSTQ